MMESPESLERVREGLARAASCCRELAVITDAQEWRQLSDQILIMRKKVLAIYKEAPLTEGQVLGLLMDMEIAQRNAQQMMVH